MLLQKIFISCDYIHILMDGARHLQCDMGGSVLRLWGGFYETNFVCFDVDFCGIIDGGL